MSWHEPYIALGFAALWGLYGVYYFTSKSAKLGKSVLVSR